jgi:hypothetical protein
MSNLPGTDLPQAGEVGQAPEGVDPARVEEAFAAFAERVRELEEVAAELRAELHALRAERAAPARSPTPHAAPSFDAERWPLDGAEGAVSADWVRAVPAPLARGNPIPRLALEAVFLLLVALCAGLADLDVAWIVLVMVTAWALVVLGEWATAVKRARWRLDEIAPPLGSEAAETTGPWDMPVVEATVVETGPDPESQTVVTKLPADVEEPEPDADPDLDPDAGAAAGPVAPRRRLRLLRRRRQEPAEAGVADPWEA